ncbi:MAG: hypothetical protein U1F43_19640 [Myxococcota bacterium]
MELDALPERLEALPETRRRQSAPWSAALASSGLGLADMMQALREDILLAAGTVGSVARGAVAGDVAQVPLHAIEQWCTRRRAGAGACTLGGWLLTR